MSSNAAASGTTSSYQTADDTENASKFRLFNSAGPLFKNIANLLGTKGTTSTTDSASPAPLDPEEIARKVAGVLADPPDLSDEPNAGPVFGATLESQIQSSEHPKVPLVLHALIRALEIHGLHQVGLYRAPGRQKEIKRFVCLANLTGLEPDTVLQSDAWKDSRVITGIIKVFFRRLAEPIFESHNWEPLTSLIPDAPLAYILLAILEKLRKSFNERHISSPAPDLDKASWRFATMDYLFNHLRRLVAMEAANQCSYECISICFGPSLFGSSSSDSAGSQFDAKLNKVGILSIIPLISPVSLQTLTCFPLSLGLGTNAPALAVAGGKHQKH